MDKHSNMFKINLRGGIVPAGELLDVLNAAEKAGVEEVRFGNRQQLFFSVMQNERQALETALSLLAVKFEIDAEEYPNIISSYVTEDIIYNAHWLKEGVYKDILDLFDFEPRLKINLTDNSQTFIPFFTGNLNFTSSDLGNYWYLHIRFPKTNILYSWPTLIYSDDIPRISKVIEDEILSHQEIFYDQPIIDGDSLHQAIESKNNFVKQWFTHPLQLPEFHLPFYEGFNRYSNQKLWLGIYRRDEIFSLAFLKDACLLCLQTRVGQLYTTPWKSIVIKGIDQVDRNSWGDILNHYRINVRHAANELNWQIEDLSKEGLAIKHQLVREFEAADTRTYRLCFAVKTKPKSGLFGSVIITKQKGKSGLFDILYTRDFNPNSKVFSFYKVALRRSQLSDHLIALCNYFYDLQGKAATKNQVNDADENIIPLKRQVYQCRHCLTIYDELYGDMINNAIAGTTFNLLEYYSCPTCGSPKTEFDLIDEPVYLA